MEKLKDYSKFFYILAVIFIAVGIIYKDNTAMFWTCIGIGVALCVVIFILRLRVTMIENKLEEQKRNEKKGIKK